MNQPTMRTRRAPPREVLISGRTASASVVTVQILCQSLTHTSPAHTRRVTRGFACGVPFTASARSFRTATLNRGIWCRD
jgi:hypothetical protein